MSLTTLIAKLPRMQPQIAKKFAQLGLVTLRDALFTFPFRHEDWRQRTPIAELSVGQAVTVAATVTRVSARRAWHRRGTTIIDTTVTDDSGAKLHIVWFNLPFLAKSLKVGDRVFLSGTITQAKDGRLQMSNPVYERPSDSPLHEKLVPVYRSTEGLSQRQFRLVLKQAVQYAAAIPDYLPAAVARQYHLMALPTALAEIHFPSDPDQARLAVERLKFDELLNWQLHLQAEQDRVTAAAAPSIPFHEPEIRSFVQHLPFALTNDQRVAAWQVLQDLAETKPMSRLIQGDVGSGKTAVAALVAYNVALSHYQVAFVAPTLVLAEQHWSTFTAMLGKHDTTIALLTGNDAKIFRAGTQTTVSRQDLLTAIANGTVSVLIGTHAILQPEISFQKLGLVIVDEQQRFGVDQRQALLADRAVTPHFLSLTATPIPRSFALWLGGILQVSTITTKPPGRQSIVSEVVTGTNRQVVDAAVYETLQHHQQIYVITPLIEESDSLGVRAATAEHERLREALPHARVGLLHGALPAAERVAVLQQFRRQELDIIVSTTVIEVGVDVPNATLIVIEGAERFGLAQLHQLRGRVGRGQAASRCLFVTDRTDTATVERLQQVAATQDGFAIAELDFQERGGGDLYGQRQSGLPTWQLATLSDQDLYRRVREFLQGLSADEREHYRQALPTTTSPSFHPE